MKEVLGRIAAGGTMSEIQAEEVFEVIMSGDATPAQIGAFLCRIFDRWFHHDVGALVIQGFDEALRPLLGVEHALCVHRETCGQVVVLEHDGSLYACDHFVDSVHYLGNLATLSLQSLADDPRLRAFGQAKLNGLALACRDCDVQNFCHGGCPKDRDANGLNRLCPAYQQFFRHAIPGLKALAAHMTRGQPLRSFHP